MLDLSKPIPPLTPNKAYAVKTLEGKWYTVYTEKGLEKVLENEVFEGICIRKTA
jgi:hypothetical protein